MGAGGASACSSVAELARYLVGVLVPWREGVQRQGCASDKVGKWPVTRWVALLVPAPFEDGSHAGRDNAANADGGHQECGGVGVGAAAVASLPVVGLDRIDAGGREDAHEEDPKSRSEMAGGTNARDVVGELVWGNGVVLGWKGVIHINVGWAAAAVVAGKTAMRMTMNATIAARVGGEGRRTPARGESAPQLGMGRELLQILIAELARYLVGVLVPWREGVQRQGCASDKVGKWPVTRWVALLVPAPFEDGSHAGRDNAANADGGHQECGGVGVGAAAVASLPVVGLDRIDAGGREDAHEEDPKSRSEMAGGTVGGGLPACAGAGVVVEGVQQQMEGWRGRPGRVVVVCVLHDPVRLTFVVAFGVPVAATAVVAGHQVDDAAGRLPVFGVLTGGGHGGVVAVHPLLLR
ncbi:hypothetical protein CYMTET_6591 [Cymbomonas tetramitiformis]|uniref:Uncharacterized protein n=1 Tax=Cymbomonas tetramitiformis TaxID=36881 RepID=A0AAE0GWT3_9CHLO|nr:hypothetical protein CYMTET_6591 [Cymbomonas tetramitiformis]